MKVIHALLPAMLLLGSARMSAIDWSTPGLNIAQGKTSYASTANASAGNDGNENSRWESQQFAPQWWCVDLGQEYDIDRVEIKWEGAYAARYELYALSDAPQYEEVTEEVTDVVASGNETKTGTFTYNKLTSALGTPFATSETNPVENLYTTVADVQNVRTRYILINCLQRQLPYGISFWEFRVSEKIADGNVAASISVPAIKATQGVAAPFKVAALNRVGGPVAENVAGATFTPSDPSITVASDGDTGYLLTGTKFGKYTMDVSAEIDGTGFTTTANVEIGVDWGNTVRNLASTKENKLAVADASHNAETAYLSNDGDNGTRWGGVSGECWWSVDLGNTYAINVAEAEFETAGAKTYEIYVATETEEVETEVDGATVKKIQPRWGETPVATATDIPSMNHIVSTVSIPDISARYVKFRFVEPNTVWSVSPYELRIGGTPDHAEVPSQVIVKASANEVIAGDPVNISAEVVGDYGTALDTDVEILLTENTSEAVLADGVLTTGCKGSVKVSAKSGDIVSEPVEIKTIAAGSDIADVARGASVIVNGDETIDGKTLIDANDGSIFIFADGGALEQHHTAVIDLHRMADIDLVRIKMEGASSSAYTVAYSADGENFTEKYSFTGEDKVDGYTHNHYGAEGKKIRYIKFDSTRNGSGYGLKIFEIGVYGELYMDHDSEGAFFGKWDADDFAAQADPQAPYIDLTAVENLPSAKPEIAGANPNQLLIVTSDAGFAADTNVLVKDAEGNMTAAAVELYNTADYSNLLSFTAAKATVHVDLLMKNVYGEAYLPFAYKAADGSKLYQFDGTASDKAVYLTEGVDEMPANTPFVVELTADMPVFAAENVEFVVPSESEVQAVAPELTKVDMIGTYSKCKPEGWDGYVVKSGELRNILTSDYVLPFAAYTNIPGITRDYPIKPYVNSIEGIGGDEAGAVVDVYTLDGVLVKSGVGMSEAADGLQPGIYVMGGRKVLVGRK